MSRQQARDLGQSLDRYLHLERPSLDERQVFNLSEVAGLSIEPQLKLASLESKRGVIYFAL